MNDNQKFGEAMAERHVPLDILREYRIALEPIDQETGKIWVTERATERRVFCLVGMGEDVQWNNMCDGVAELITQLRGEL